MTAKASTLIENTADREIVISRVFDAPRELVWKAWTDPEHIVHWWGPRGFTTTIEQMDLRPGGVWKFVMHGPDGTDYANRSVFVEVTKPERIVFTHGGSREGGPAAKFVSTWTFIEQRGKTEVTIRMVFDTAAERDTIVREYGAIEGGEQTLERLQEQLARLSGEQFVISRTFDAPRELVFKAWTEPQHLAQWWGPKGMAIKVHRLNLERGGIFHYSMHTPDGHEMWGKFVYREIVPPARLVFVNSFSDKDAGITRHPMSAEWPLEVLSVITFTETAGKTTVKLQGIPINATESERKTFAAGFESMKKGFGGTLDQLAEHLAGV